MRYLVTGGAGFIGSHLVEELSKTGDVLVIDNLTHGTLRNLKGIKYDFTCRDVTDPGIGSLFKGIDYVFHQACAKCVFCRDDPYNDLMVNAYGTLNVIEQSIKYGVKKVIHAATGSTNHYQPHSLYGVSKTAGELYYRVMKEYYPDFRYTILRYYHVYGSKQDVAGVIPKFIDRVKSGKPIEVYGGQQVRHCTHVDDIVKANIAAVKGADYETMDVANSESITIEDLAYFIRGLLKKPDHPIDCLDYQKGDIKKFNIDNSRATELIGQFRPLEEGIKETVEWYEKSY